MFKKLIAILLLLAFIAAPVFSAAELSYKPYDDEEFPVWSLHLRRAESIFFGSYVITLPVSILLYNSADLVGIKTPTEDNTRILQQALIATGLSLFITGLDYILGLND